MLQAVFGIVDGSTRFSVLMQFGWLYFLLFDFWMVVDEQYLKRFDVCSKFLSSLRAIDVYDSILEITQNALTEIGMPKTRHNWCILNHSVV